MASDRYFGFLETIRERTIKGWVVDRAYPDQRVALLLRVNDAYVISAIAGHRRPDVAAAGFGDGYCGFEAVLPENISNIESVAAIVADSMWEIPALENPICRETNQQVPDEWRAGSSFRHPSLFILGAAKSGTTSLHGYLDQHPDICMSKPKEPFFFEAEYDKGPSFYFNRYFAHWRGEKHVGEARHRNLYLPYAAQRIFQYNRCAKLVVILRDPVERAVSHWWHWFSRGWEPLGLRDALAADLRRIESGLQLELPEERRLYEITLNAGLEAATLAQYGRSCYRTYLDSGWYPRQIRRYTDLFGVDKLHVILLDELAENPTAAMSAALTFLEVDPDHAKRIDYKKLNESAPAMAEHVDEPTIDWLRDYYRPFNAELEAMLGRSLTAWSRPFQISV